MNESLIDLLLRGSGKGVGGVKQTSVPQQVTTHRGHAPRPLLFAEFITGRGRPQSDHSTLL